MLFHCGLTAHSCLWMRQPKGLEIALESTIMGAPYLADGRLVALFPAHHVVTAQGHFAVYSTSHALRPQAATFIDWLRQQASDCV
jgi:DNA-binding transcriptional LysR family regulator